MSQDSHAPVKEVTDQTKKKPRLPLHLPRYFRQFVQNKKGKLLLFVMSGILALVVVLALFVNTMGEAKSIHEVSAIPETPIEDAVSYLSNAPGAHYVGTITSSSSGTAQVDLHVTNDGSASGNLVWDGESCEIIVMDNKTFLKASQAFWRTHGAPKDSEDAYSKQWVKMSTQTLGFDIQQLLAPMILGGQINQERQANQVTIGSNTTIKDVQVVQVQTPSAVLSITTAKPHRIIHIKGTASAQGKGAFLPSVTSMLPYTAGARESGDAAYQLDVTNDSVTEAENLFDQLKKKVEELPNAVDSEVQAQVEGQLNLTSVACKEDPKGCCPPTSCTATLALSASSASSPVTVDVTINMQVDGATANTCTQTTTLPTSISCSVSYAPAYEPAPAHIIAAVWSATPLAMSTDAVQNTNKHLDEHRKNMEKNTSNNLTRVISDLAKGNITKQQAANTLKELLGKKVIPEFPITDPARQTIYNNILKQYPSLDKTFLNHLVAINPGITQLSQEQIMKFLNKATSQNDLERIILLYTYIYNRPGLDRLLRDIANGNENNYNGSLFQLEQVAALNSEVQEIELLDANKQKGPDILLTNGKYIDTKAYKYSGPFLLNIGISGVKKQITGDLARFPDIREHGLIYIFKSGKDGLNQEALEKIKADLEPFLRDNNLEGVITFVLWPEEQQGVALLSPRLLSAITIIPIASMREQQWPEFVVNQQAA